MSLTLKGMPMTETEREQLLANVILLAEIQKGDVIGEGDERRIGQLLAFVRDKLAEPGDGGIITYSNTPEDFTKLRESLGIELKD